MALLKSLIYIKVWESSVSTYSRCHPKDFHGSFGPNLGLRNLGQVTKCYPIFSTLTAKIFLHYRVATKTALEILGYTMCRVR